MQKFWLERRDLMKSKNRFWFISSGIAASVIGFSTAFPEAWSFDCYNKPLVVTDTTVSKEKKCASDRISGINSYVTFAESGCSEYVSIISSLRRIQINSEAIYDGAKTKDAELKANMDAAASEFGDTGKAHYRVARYENWLKTYKTLLDKGGSIKDMLEEAGKVRTTRGSAGNSSMEYQVTHKDDLPCTKSSTGASGTGATGIATKPVTPGTIRPSPSPKPSPRPSLTPDDLFDDCKDPSIRATRTYCGKKYECIRWREVP